ncbi:MAG: tetratricopeptide repeat protein [Myxococcales bacterium]|nr:tetratricopeptide repeat protein [Myxococcales bacterium]
MGDPSVALHVTGGSRDRLSRLWALRRERLARNDVEGAAEILARMLVLRRDRGLARLDAPALALIREAEAAAAEGAGDVATDRLVAAERLAPGLPEVHSAHARVETTLKPWAVHRWLQQRFRALSAALSDFQYRMLFLADLVLMGLLVLSLLGVLFALAQLIRYSQHLFHDLGQTFPGVMRLGLLGAGALLFLLPFFFGFGPLVVLFPLAILIWPYQQRSERLLSVLFVLLLGAAPWALRIGDRLTEAGTGVTQAMHALSLNPDDRRALDQVEAQVAADPKDWHARAVLGLALKRRGTLAQALPLLQTAAADAPVGEAAGTVYNNLGNALFANGQAAAAQQAYQRAAELLPTSAAPPFNLHRLLLRRGERVEAQKALAQATALDPHTAARWNEDDDLSLNRHVVDLPLPAGLLTRRALAEVTAPTPVATRAWVVLAGPVPELAAPLGAAMTLLAFVVLVALGPRMRLTWPCARTGAPVTVYMAQGYPDRPLSEQYIDVFLKNVPVDRTIRFALETRAARYTRFKRWATLAAGLVPGLVGLVRGRPLRGALVLGASLALGLLVWAPSGLLLEPVDTGVPGTLRWVCLGGLGLLWILSLIRAFRWPEEAA